MSVLFVGKAALDRFAAKLVSGPGEDDGPKAATLCLTAAVKDLPSLLSQEIDLHSPGAQIFFASARVNFLKKYSQTIMEVCRRRLAAPRSSIRLDNSD